MPFGITGQGKAGSITPLTITSIQPAGGLQAGGEVVDIYGSGFELGMTAKIDGNLCTGLIVQSANQLTCTTPAGTAGAKAVRLDRVTTAANATLAGGYTYAADTIVSISSAGGLEDWQTTAGVVITTNFTLATPPVVTVNGVAATSIVRDSATQLTCTFPAAIVPATADTLAADVVVDAITSGGVGAFSYLWSPHSLAAELLWDFRRGVTATTTATAVTNSGTGGTNGNLAPVGAAQTYTAADTNLNSKPTITMTTGGYTMGGAVSVGNEPVAYFMIAYHTASGGIYTGISGTTYQDHWFYKHPDDTIYFQSLVPSLMTTGSAWSGKQYLVLGLDGASSTAKDKNGSYTGDPGTAVMPTSFVIGESGNLAGQFPFVGSVALCGVRGSVLSANELTRFASFASRVYGVT